MTHDALHLVTALVGALAAGMLMWRVIGFWPDTTRLVHVLGVLLAASVLLGALILVVLPPGSTALAIAVECLLLLHRLVCIAVAVMWPTWMDRTRTTGRPLLS